MIDCPPQPVDVVTVTRPLTVGLPPEKYAAVAAGIMTMVATVRNPRKDRYFFAKRPLQARISVLGTNQTPILRDITRIECTAEAWFVYF